MKIIKEKKDNPPVAVTFRLPEKLLDKLTEVSDKNGISRQKLVTAILNQAMTDKKFKLTIKD